MDAQAYVLIAIVVLAVVFAVRLWWGEQRGRLTPLAGIAFQRKDPRFTHR